MAELVASVSIQGIHSITQGHLREVPEMGCDSCKSAKSHTDETGRGGSSKRNKIGRHSRVKKWSPRTEKHGTHWLGAADRMRAGQATRIIIEGAETGLDVVRGLIRTPNPNSASLSGDDGIKCRMAADIYPHNTANVPGTNSGMFKNPPEADTQC